LGRVENPQIQDGGQIHKGILNTALIRQETASNASLKYSKLKHEHATSAKYGEYMSVSQVLLGVDFASNWCF